MLPVFGSAPVEAGRPPVQDVKGGIPKEAPSPTCPESAFWRDAGRGPCRGRVSAENLALWARMRGGRGPRGERPRPREGCVPACGALLPSTLKTAQKETWSTEVNSSRTGRDWPSGPAPSSFTPSPGAQECGTLGSPGVFSLPFPRFKFHSSLRLARNSLIVPHLLETTPAPPGSSPNRPFSRLAESISLAGSAALKFTGPTVRDLRPQGSPRARSGLH